MKNLISLLLLISFAVVYSSAFVLQPPTFSVRRLDTRYYHVHHKKSLSSSTILFSSIPSPESSYYSKRIIAVEEKKKDNGIEKFVPLLFGMLALPSVSSSVGLVINLSSIYLGILTVLTGLSFMNDVFIERLMGNNDNNLEDKEEIAWPIPRV